MQEHQNNLENDEYSGVNYVLSDICSHLRSDDMINRRAKLEDENIIARDVIAGVKSEFMSKVREVQNATALRVLSRYYKKIEFNEAAT
jgi:hypothetical protein